MQWNIENIPHREFVIGAIRVLDRCSQEIRKVLKEEWYVLNGSYYVDKLSNELRLRQEDDQTGVFRPGISVSAIVGMNGRGK